ncbi:HIT domain-containing protein [Candidatus Parcubacteria bacterium]|jgi:histidine triad (HIT) family protein|nr:MAG: HIT domain-containing protein [Candidatus Parcubacteria bacterium]
MVCIFCKIAQKEIPSEIVWESETLVAFKDIHPMAPVHVLLIPKKHIASLVDFEPVDQKLMAEIIAGIGQVAKILKLKHSGFQTLIRTGRDGGQEVEHLHIHILHGTHF